VGANLSFTLSAKGDCEAAAKTCTSTFKVAAAPELVITCPTVAPNLAACTLMADIQKAYDTWKAGFTVKGGCNTVNNLDKIPALPANVACVGANLSFTLSAKGDCEAAAKTCTSTFKVAAAPEISCTAELTAIPKCGDKTVTAKVIITGGCQPYTIMWDNNPALNTEMVELPIINELILYKVKVTTDCGLTECEVIVEPVPCQTEGTVCTYTQGYYGNYGGISCDGEKGGYSTVNLIDHSIATWGGTLTIGKGTRAVTVSTGQANCVVERMPGGTAVEILPIGPISICDYTLLSKQGRINNKLLAQTLALGLNLGIGTPLGDVQLDQGWIVTAKPDGGCGSDVPLNQECIYEETDVNLNGKIDLINIVNPYFSCKIDQSVLDMLIAISQPATVNGLYELANQALGGVGVYTKSQLTAISGNVDKINNVFDECRILLYYSDVAPDCSKTKSAFITAPEASSLKVYPNPFGDKVYLEFASATDSHATLEITNILGQKVTTLMSQMVNKGELNRVEYEPTGEISGIYFYRLILDGNVQIGKLVYKKE